MTRITNLSYRYRSASDNVAKAQEKLPTQITDNSTGIGNTLAGTGNTGTGNTGKTGKIVEYNYTGNLDKNGSLISMRRVIPGTSTRLKARVVLSSTESEIILQGKSFDSVLQVERKTATEIFAKRVGSKGTIYKYTIKLEKPTGKTSESGALKPAKQENQANPSTKGTKDSTPRP